jgi:hypothetical protein
MSEEPNLREVIRQELERIERERETKKREHESKFWRYAGPAVALGLWFILGTVVISECSARRVFQQYIEIIKPSQPK